MSARLITALAVAVLAAGPSVAAPVPDVPGADALAAVPASAPIVVHVRGVERTKDRLTAFLNAAAPDFGPVAAAQLDAMVKDGVQGRKLEGLAKDGPLFICLLELPAPGAANDPPMALIAKVTGYAAFRDALLTGDERKNLKKEAGYEQADVNGRETFFVDRQGFAVVTTNKDAAEMLAKKPAGLGDKLSADLSKQLLENDLSLYVNLTAVNKEYGDQIKAGRQFMETILDSMPAGGASKQSMEYAKGMYGVLFQAVEDGRAFLAGADFRPEGLNIHLQFQVGAGTKSNTFLHDQKPVSLDALGTLPTGLTTYTGSHMSGDLFKAMAPLILGTVGGEGEGQKQAEAAFNKLIEAGGTGSYSGANLPPAGLQVQTFADPAKGVVAMLSMFKAMGEGGTFQNAFLKGKPEIKENVQDHKAFKLHSVHFVWDLDKFAESIPGGGDAMKAAMKKLMGDDLRLWFGTDGKQVVTITAKDWDAARAQLDGYLEGRTTLAKDAAYTATRKQLPAETTLLMLADAGRFTHVMADYMVTMFKAMPVLPIKLPDEVKPVKTKTSYLGFAVTLRSEKAGIDMFVPVIAVQEMRKVIMPLFQGN